MAILILGLALLLGVHSVRVVADPWRSACVARWGLGRWKLAYALLAALGMGLIVWGVALARADPVLLWSPPAWGRHAAALLLVPSFVLLVAAHVRGTHIKQALGHPMVAAVALWALAHLFANGRLADLALFGAFLVWSLACLVAARRRDRIAGTRYPALGWGRDALALVAGIVLWGLFAHVLHEKLIGLRPFP